MSSDECTALASEKLLRWLWWPILVQESGSKDPAAHTPVLAMLRELMATL